MLNRSAVIVRPKMPFYDWFRALVVWLPVPKAANTSALKSRPFDSTTASDKGALNP